jgi:hypothetical protein
LGTTSSVSLGFTECIAEVVTSAAINATLESLVATRGGAVSFGGVLEV